MRVSLATLPLILFLLVAGCTESVSSSSDAGPDAADTPDAGGTGTTCEDGTTCEEGLVCTYFLWSCNQYAHCSPPVTGCTKQVPTCGCDGHYYPSACEAQQAGFDTSTSRCTPPAGTFRCGYTYCKDAEELCVEDFEGSYTCEPLPPSCMPFASADCSCLTGDGGIVVPGNHYSQCNFCTGDKGVISVSCSP